MTTTNLVTKAFQWERVEIGFFSVLRLKFAGYRQPIEFFENSCFLTLAKGHLCIEIKCSPKLLGQS